MVSSLRDFFRPAVSSFLSGSCLWVQPLTLQVLVTSSYLRCCRVGTAPGQEPRPGLEKKVDLKFQVMSPKDDKNS